MSKQDYKFKTIGTKFLKWLIVSLVLIMLVTPAIIFVWEQASYGKTLLLLLALSAILTSLEIPSLRGGVASVLGILISLAGFYYGVLSTETGLYGIDSKVINKQRAALIQVRPEVCRSGVSKEDISLRTKDAISKSFTGSVDPHSIGPRYFYAFKAFEVWLSHIDICSTGDEQILCSKEHLALYPAFQADTSTWFLPYPMKIKVSAEAVEKCLVRSKGA